MNNKYNSISPFLQTPLQPNNIIYYKCPTKIPETTSTNYYGNGIHINQFGKAKLIKHKFKDGIGTLIFDKEITKLNQYAFAGSGFTEIQLPNSLLEIGDYAFSSCRQLVSFQFNEGLKKIGSSVFSSDTNLRGTIIVPDSVEHIGYGAFIGTYLDNLIIGKGIKTLERYAIEQNNRNCVLYLNYPHIENKNYCISTSYFSKIIFGDNVKSIENSAFYGASIESIVFGNYIESIGDQAFANSYIEELILPNSVTHLGREAFRYCNNLTSVKIGNGITTIPAQCFYSCSKISTIIMSDSVRRIETQAFYSCNNYEGLQITWSKNLKYIGSEAFYNCYRLSEVVIPKKVEVIEPKAFGSCSETPTLTILSNKLKVISESAFENCRCFQSIIIPEGVEKIESNAFKWCDKVSSIYIPSSVKEISPTAFTGIGTNVLESIIVNEKNTVYDSRNNCNALIETSTNRLILSCKNTTIPNNIEIISSYAFSGNLSLTEFNAPDSITTIESNAFSGCNNLTSVTLTDNITDLGDHVFSGCENLTTVVLPSNLTEIKEYSFNNCLSLTNITLPNTLTSIGTCAFNSCKSFTNITIPENVISIGNYAFRGCSNLETITVDNNNSVYDSRNNCNALIETETNILLLGSINTTIPDNVVSIGNSAFYNVNITSIDLSSVTSIGNSAFCYCPLSVIDLSNVTSIGDNAFRYCSLLSDINNLNNIEFIGTYAFSQCPLLTEIDLPNSLTNLPNGLFSGCTGLLQVSLPNNITAIPQYMFNSCTHLISVGPSNSGASVEIPDTVTIIKASAFGGCAGITNVTIPSSITTIETGAFYGTQITDITIPNTVTNIGDYAFDSSTLVTVTFDSNTITSKQYSYYGSQSIQKIFGNANIQEFILGENITSLGAYAFNTLKATRITIPSNVTTASSSAFWKCNTETAIIGNTVLLTKDYDYNLSNFSQILRPIKNIIISEGVTSIGQNVFKDSYDIKTITLPSTITRIGNMTLRLGSTATITVLATTPPVFYPYTNDYEFYYNPTIYVPAESVNAYKTANAWRRASDRIQAIPTE